MENNNDVDPNNFTINFEKVIADKTMLTVTRMLAVDLQRSPYMTVGEFIKGLSKGDLDTLLELADIMREEEEGDDPSASPHCSELLLIVEMLARAEGIHSADISEVVDHVNAFGSLLVLESLHRKGLVEVFHDNMSFGLDAGDKLIAKKID